MNSKKKEKIWLYSALSMMLFSTCLLLSTSCNGEKRNGVNGGEGKDVEISKDGYSCIQTSDPAEDKVYTISFKRDEDFVSMDIEPKGELKALVWETSGEKAYTVSVSAAAEIIYFDADIVLIEYSNGHFITIIIDRNVYTNQAQQAICLTAGRMVKKYREEFKGKIPAADIFYSLRDLRGDLISGLGFSDLKTPIFRMYNPK